MAMAGLNGELALRLGAFVGLLAAFALWETLRPRRKRMLRRSARWPGNLGVVLLDTLTVRLLAPAAVVGAAVIGQDFGLFARVHLPAWLAGLLGFIVLDGVIYAQHVVFHHVPVLWRLHRMHHADLDLDVTTALRFHPFEILISLGIKIAAVVIFGIPAGAVMMFEIVLNGAAMFNHANASVPERIEPWLRAFVVTPQMHEVHHSLVRQDTDSNFGFNLSVWDRLCGTYREAPTRARDDMPVVIGLSQFRDPIEARIDRMLTQPFRHDEAGVEEGAVRKQGKQ